MSPHVIIYNRVPTKSCVILELPVRAITRGSRWGVIILGGITSRVDSTPLGLVEQSFSLPNFSSAASPPPPTPHEPLPNLLSEQNKEHSIGYALPTVTNALHNTKYIYTVLLHSVIVLYIASGISQTQLGSLSSRPSLFVCMKSKQSPK